MKNSPYALALVLLCAMLSECCADLFAAEPVPTPSASTSPAPTQPIDAPLRPVGVAAVDITPDYPIRLGGYGSRRDVNQGVAQRLFAKALAIGSDEEGPAVLVTVDNVGVSNDVRAEVLKRLAAKTRVSDASLAIASSHTHSGPMLMGVTPNLFSMDIPAEQVAAIERYTRDLTDWIEQAALAALADRQPARLAWSVGRVGFAANRRGYPLKPVDHDLPVLGVWNEDGKLRAIFASYACHATTIASDAIHGDWPGCAQLALQRQLPDAVALIALGCAADQNPHPRGTVELAVQHGEVLATEAVRVVQGQMRPVGGRLDCRAKWIELAYDTLPTRDQWQTLAESRNPAVAYHAKKNLARLDRGETLPTEVPYLVQAWIFGDDLAMVFLSGEVVVDYALCLKRQYDPDRLWVNGYANAMPFYVPSQRILSEGGYEAGGAMVYFDRPTRLADDVEQRVLDAVHGLLPEGFRVRPDGVKPPPAPVAVAYPDHSQLLVVRDERGESRPVETVADWAQRAAHIRANMQQVMGLLDDTSGWAPLDVEIVSTQQADGYVRRKLRFTPEVGDRVPAWLLIPDGLSAGARAPAMLCLHQTTAIGKDEPAGLGGLASLHYAHELAQRGYVCLVPDYPSFGEYPYDFRRQPGRWASGSLKAIWNNIRAVDLLEACPEVDRNRIGVIGHSLGGHNAMFTAVFDQRLKAVVSSCGFTPFHDYYGGKVAGWTSDRYMPRIRDVYENDPDRIPFDFYEVVAALAPRGFFSNSPVHDSNFDIEGVRKAFAKAEQVYGLFGAADRLRLVTPDAPHDFPEAERRAAYAWLDSVLK